MGNTWEAMNRQVTHGNNSELNYLEITEEILDGIFPEEEIKKVKLLEHEKKLCGDFIIDIYGRPQLVSDFKTAKESEVKQEEDIEYRRLHQCIAILSLYANIHISIIFIIILSFLSCIFSNIISVLTTIIIIVSIVTVDYKYKLGLAVWDSELIS